MDGRVGEVVAAELGESFEVLSLSVYIKVMIEEEAYGKLGGLV